LGLQICGLLRMNQKIQHLHRIDKQIFLEN
jgi:hypothetical protein